jgi:hypothetical protein
MWSSFLFLLWFHGCAAVLVHKLDLISVVSASNSNNGILTQAIVHVVCWTVWAGYYRVHLQSFRVKAICSAKPGTHCWGQAQLVHYHVTTCLFLFASWSITVYLRSCKAPLPIQLRIEGDGGRHSWPDWQFPGFQRDSKANLDALLLSFHCFWRREDFGSGICKVALIRIPKVINLTS